ncbi:hypothetical protein [Xanthomonas phage BUDD]|nr:hypothetical protein [Xanthomonas phage BUDD]
MSTEIELLYEKLDQMGMRLGGLTLGDNPKNAEAVARELRLSLERLEDAGLEEITDFDCTGEPTQEKIDRDKRALARMQKRADEIKAKTRDLKRELGKDLMAYAETNLRPYSYGKAGIEDAVDNIVRTAHLDEYDPDDDNYGSFWLPSNFGC